MSYLFVGVMLLHKRELYIDLYSMFELSLHDSHNVSRQFKTLFINRCLVYEIIENTVSRF